MNGYSIRSYGFVALAVAAGCSEAPNDATQILDTRVTGLVWRDGPVPDVAVAVSDSQGTIAQGVTNREGQFAIALGALSGWVEVKSDGLRQRVLVAEVGQTVDEVLLSPIGTLAEAYVDAPVPGSRAARLDIVSSFFRVPLTGDRWTMLDRPKGTSCRDLDDATTYTAVWSGLLQAGLRYLGQTYIETAGVAAPADEILNALVLDLSSDGLFDGQGPDEQPVLFAGQRLEPTALRMRYVDALVAFLRSPRNRSGFTVDCFKRDFDELRFSRSPLFAPASWLEPEFTTGCAACTRIATGEILCTAGDCGPCGVCQIDYATREPTAQCEPRADRCPGNCDRCAPNDTGREWYACIPEPSACTGTCATCSATDDGGFACRANPERCEGNCASCQADAEDDTAFHCAPNPDRCQGDCAACTGADRTFTCQADATMCPGPQASGTFNCSACRQRTPELFVCEDDRRRCPEDTMTVTGPCQSDDGICATVGLESVRTDTWTCRRGECINEPVQTERLCIRETDGINCGALQCETPFSNCQPIRICADEGERTRSCNQPICDNGTCTNQRTVVQTESCSTPSEGRRCGSQSCTQDGRMGEQFMCCRQLACTEVCSACFP